MQPDTAKVKRPSKRAAQQTTPRQTALGCGCLLIVLVVVLWGGASVLGLITGSGGHPSRATQRADFRSFYAQLAGAIQACDDTSQTAVSSFQSAAKGGDTLTAYQDAKTAHDACNNASVAVTLLNRPGSLSDASLHLDDAKQDYANGATTRSDVWQSVEGVLQNPSDLSAQSDVLSKISQAKTFEDLGVAWIVSDAMSLTVTLSQITPIPPTPMRG